MLEIARAARAKRIQKQLNNCKKFNRDNAAEDRKLVATVVERATVILISIRYFKRSLFDIKYRI